MTTCHCTPQRTMARNAMCLREAFGRSASLVTYPSVSRHTLAVGGRVPRTTDRQHRTHAQPPWPMLVFLFFRRGREELPATQTSSSRLAVSMLPETTKPWQPEGRRGFAVLPVRFGSVRLVYASDGRNLSAALLRCDPDQ